MKEKCLIWIFNIYLLGNAQYFNPRHSFECECCLLWILESQIKPNVLMNSYWIHNTGQKKSMAWSFVNGSTVLLVNIINHWFFNLLFIYLFHIFINVRVDEVTRISRERRPFKLQLLQIYSATAFFMLNVASVAKLPDPPVSIITRTNNVLFEFEFNYLLPYFFTVTVTF